PSRRASSSASTPSPALGSRLRHSLRLGTAVAYHGWRKIRLDPHATSGRIPSSRWTMAFTVSQVARMAGVSVRTLHHYDQIGLLRPSGRSEAGYRLYDRADLERLQQVMFFRALEVPLEEIARIMTDPDFDVGAALRM